MDTTTAAPTAATFAALWTRGLSLQGCTPTDPCHRLAFAVYAAECRMYWGSPSVGGWYLSARGLRSPQGGLQYIDSRGEIITLSPAEVREARGSRKEYFEARRAAYEAAVTLAQDWTGLFQVRAGLRGPLVRPVHCQPGSDWDPAPVPPGAEWVSARRAEVSVTLPPWDGTPCTAYVRRLPPQPEVVRPRCGRAWSVDA